MTLSEVAWRLVQQKLKYAYKTLSEDTLEQNIYTFLDMFDFLSFSFDFTITDTLFSSLLASIMFNIPLSDVIPVSMDFRIELPSPDEFAKGLLIKIEPISIFEIYPELLTLSMLYYNVFEPDIASTLLGSQLEKGIYGRSRYDMAYYDPPAVREFFRSTMFALAKKRSTDGSVRARIESIANALNINKDLASYIFNSLQMMYYAKSTACSLDYCWFDVSMFPIEGSEAKILFVGWDLQPVEAEYISIVDASGSCWFDNCLFDVNLFSPDEPPTIYIPERAGNLLTEVSMYMYQRARSRLLATPFALANYQTAEERLNPATSPRVETYGSNVFLVEDVRRAVLSYVSRFEASPIKQNLYVVAALDLVKRLSKPGGWGDEAFKAMSREELLTYFLDRWGSQGLDKTVLENIFNMLYDSKLVDRFKHIRSQTKQISKWSRGGK